MCGNIEGIGNTAAGVCVCKVFGVWYTAACVWQWRYMLKKYDSNINNLLVLARDKDVY